MIKIVFFDIDGTLVSLKTKVASSETKSAICELRRRGTLVYIATGRNCDEIQSEDLLEGIEYDGLLSNNGQAAYGKDGNILFDIPVNPEDIENLLSWVEKTQTACWAVGRAGAGINLYNNRVREAMAAIHTKLPPIADLKKLCSADIYKLVLFLTEQEMAEPLALMPHSRTAQWHRYGFDMMSQDGGKGVGVLKVLQSLGLRREESMAFGDGDNDMDMLKAAGIGIAMGNAPDHVKAAADWVTEDVDANGLALALSHFGMI